ncbi:hypothetical protein GCM10028895_17680 [Pontibacter rugosus]
MHMNTASKAEAKKNFILKEGIYSEMGLNPCAYALLLPAVTEHFSIISQYVLQNLTL